MADCRFETSGMIKIVKTKRKPQRSKFHINYIFKFCMIELKFAAEITMYCMLSKLQFVTELRLQRITLFLICVILHIIGQPHPIIVN